MVVVSNVLFPVSHHYYSISIMYCVQKGLRVEFEKNGVRWWSRACYQTVQRRRTNNDNVVSGKCAHVFVRILDRYTTKN